MKNRYALALLAGIALNSLAMADEPIAFTRLWNNQHHLYTTNCTAERQAMRQGYNLEGIAGYIAPRQAADTVPLYQLFDGSDYLFTIDPVEKDSAKKYGYHFQGIAGYIASHPLPNTIPLYRSVNNARGDHLFTTSVQEWSHLVQAGYQKEIIAGYVWSAGQKSCQSPASAAPLVSRLPAPAVATSRPITHPVTAFGVALPTQQQGQPRPY